ncbi:NAD-dependent epimerase [Neiella sp. HB171785]|uniref:NAD-dependent epimerase n=1 Tax=Neiella litorisoli TaxID=2771431 RepID=A0A8J6UJJ2_9GAMM|nr:NAD-dependent epimerase [Neiella litorisoli]MBD1390708.1 NAD-dependent epimerase [Neiella litorisoli]
MKVLVTGAAGFIGFYVSKRLIADGHQVVGIDNINSYYDVGLKHARLAQLESLAGFEFIELDLADRPAMAQLFADHRFQRVIHLAAQAGVRHSLNAPFDYVDSNMTGMMTILEGCRHHGVEHLVYASSSSVYGMNETMPFTTSDNVDHPVSLYAASKKANELMAHSYSHLYGLPTTGLRFFTVYGPWGRPDMAYFLFTKAMLAGDPIKVFNFGKMRRDFTYIDDIVEGVVRVMDKLPEPNPNWRSDDPSTSKAPYKVYNIGNNNPVELGYFIETLERCLGIEANKLMMPMQPGDVVATAANIDDLVEDVGFSPATSVEQGLESFVRWYKSYYR